MKAWIVTDEDGLATQIANFRFFVYPTLEGAQYDSYRDYQPQSINILTDQELEQIKEQVARQAFEVAYQYFYGMEFSPSDDMLEYCWNDWQKNKGEG